MYDLWATEIDSSVNYACLHKHNEENNLENTFNEMHFIYIRENSRKDNFTDRKKWGVNWLSLTESFINKSFQCNRQSN